MRIAVLEDDAIQSKLLSSWLGELGHDVHSFKLTRNLQRVATRESFDLFLLDWMVPDITGTEFLRWLRHERQNRVPAIFITSRDAEDDVIEGLAAGADDFLIKPVNQRILLARVEAVMRRYVGIETETAIEAMPYTVDFSSKRIFLAGEDLGVTDKEFDLAAFLFRNVGRLLSRGHLLESVWGHQPDLATRTVDTHISRVRTKLRLRPETGYRLSPIYNFGYRLEHIDSASAASKEKI